MNASRMRAKVVAWLVMAMMGVGGMVHATMFSYTETFGTGGPTGLVAGLGWTQTLGADVLVDNVYGTYPGWGGRAVNPTTAATSPDYHIFQKTIPGLPAMTNGLWVFSGCFRPLGDGAGGRNNAQGSYASVNSSSAAIAYLYALGNNADSWQFDVRGLTGGSGDWLRFGGIGNFDNAPVLGSIYIDLDNKKTWATLSNQVTGASTTSAAITFTTANAFDRFQILVDKRDGQTGLPMDNLKVEQVVPEPGTSALLGLGGLLTVLRRRR